MLFSRSSVRVCVCACVRVSECACVCMCVCKGYVSNWGILKRTVMLIASTKHKDSACFIQAKRKLFSCYAQSRRR